MRVAALYVAPTGPYFRMAEVDPWGADRNAKLYRGPHPVIAHPPCGPWGQLAWRCTKQDPRCAIVAVSQIIQFGGVLEHPARSKLWRHLNLPLPGDKSNPSLWTLETEQCRWGHKALKKTWLLFSRIPPEHLSPIPPWREPTHVIDSSKAQKRRGAAAVRHLPKSQRHLTPPDFAEWLVLQARKVS